MGVGRRGCGPLHPPPRFAPFLSLHELLRAVFETLRIVMNCVAWLPTAMADSDLLKRRRGTLLFRPCDNGGRVGAMGLLIGRKYRVLSLYPSPYRFGTSQGMFVVSFSCRFWNVCSFRRIQKRTFDLKKNGFRVPFGGFSAVGSWIFFKGLIQFSNEYLPLLEWKLYPEVALSMWNLAIDFSWKNYFKTVKA